MKVQTLNYTARNCDICGNSDLEPAYSFKHQTKTLHYQWNWNVNNVICKQCGFTFVSPVPDEKALDMYYADSFGLFTKQRPDYSISKRIKIIKDYLELVHDIKYLEIGSNRCPDFLSQLESFIPEVRIHTFEPNKSCHSNYNSFSGIPAESYNLISSYFVLEHLVKPGSFLENCYKICEKNGYLILEVPDIYNYPTDPSALILCEHVNHFSPVSLVNLAASVGFSLVQLSKRYCSRPYGFLAVFQKGNEEQTDVVFDNTVVHKARACMKEGGNAIFDFEQRLLEIRQRINDAAEEGKTALLWAANGICKRLLENYKAPVNTVLVDINKEKKNSFKDFPVHSPEEVVEQIRNSFLLVINSARHVNDICKWIKTNANHQYEAENIIICDYVIDVKHKE